MVTKSIDSPNGLSDNAVDRIHDDVDTHSDQLSPRIEVWTVQRVLTWSAGWLRDKFSGQLESPRFEAEVLLAFVLGLDRMKLFMQLDRPLTRDEREQFKLALRQRGEGMPVAYILGYRDFYRHRFKVSPAVLIPRPDTELLVELSLAAARGLASPRILDVGTGSGCVAISLAAELPSANVDAWDISDEALAIAGENASALGVANVHLMPRNALDPKAFAEAIYDVIVSNPPYIAADERPIMRRETLIYEPELALFPKGADGLDFYRAFAERAAAGLSPSGKIFLEIGLHQAEKVTQLFNDAGWRKITVVKDISGHDRVISAQRP